MNKSYIYNAGNVTVIDENGDVKFIDYSDNLEEILIKENLIETIEDNMRKFEDSLDYNYRPYIPFTVPALFLIGPGFNLILNHLYGPMDNLALFIGLTTLGLLPIAVPLEIKEYLMDKNYKKDCQADVTTYEYLQNELKKQKENLELLQNNKSKENEISDFTVKKVNDIEELEILKMCLILFNNLGSDFKKYYDFYQQDKLETILASEGYSEPVCQRANQFLDEKSDVLIKKYNFPVKKSNR